MGTIIEINDTLQISQDQGFPIELDYTKHVDSPFKAEQFSGRIFEFKDKPGIRLYQSPPVRNFLVENKNGKWIYWGLIHILETVHDHVNKTTRGKYNIIYIYTPEEMSKAHEMIDRNPNTKF